MKRFTHAILAAAVASLTLGVGDAVAQVGQRAQRGPADRDGRIERHIERLNQRLQLSSEQQSRVRAMLQEHIAAMDRWREAHSSATREERRDHARESMEALRAQLRSILTEEQAAQLEERPWLLQPRFDDDDWWGWQGDRPWRMRGNGPMRGDRPWQMQGNWGWVDQLDLSDEQRAELNRLREAHRAEMQAWREERANLSPEQRREQMLERMERHREQVMNLLTDEQRRELEQMRQTWRQERREFRRGDRPMPRQRDMQRPGGRRGGGGPSPR